MFLNPVSEVLILASERKTHKEIATLTDLRIDRKSSVLKGKSEASNVSPNAFLSEYFLRNVCESVKVAFLWIIEGLE